MTARLAVDIGGTFTDFALEIGDRLVTHKALTTPTAPERAVIEGVRAVIDLAAIKPAQVTAFIHGTTLATNAIIERKGARTALVTTRGFRDSLEIAYEHRFDQYDVMIDKPEPIVPRPWRLEVTERIDSRGNIVLPLDEASLAPVIAALKAARIEAVAVGLLHSYANPAHEARVGALLTTALPGVAITLSSEVCPEMREYERLSTAAANAYVQPIMAGYLGRLAAGLKSVGVDCPTRLITSGGGLTTLENARRFPIRLVESGPAGGAILARRIAAQCGFDRVLSFDMGGTTAKICLIDDGHPEHARLFEVARQYRYQKGSGLPLRIPVIEMVEIGAGGGSIARIDAMKRLQVGPDSAGSEPGPACYRRGGENPTVTDADLTLGRIDPAGFAGGHVSLDRGLAEAAIAARIAAPLKIETPMAALGISDVVEEHMANAARIHAVERGKRLGERVLIAFGGAAPLHAARLAEKLDVATVVIPSGAGVGSALGFLAAPAAYEVVRSRHLLLDRFEAETVNALFDAMRAEARGVVAAVAGDAALDESRHADMRYRGQGHEIAVPLPAIRFGDDGAAVMRAAFEREYEKYFGRVVPGMTIEVMGWSLRLAARQAPVARVAPDAAIRAAKPVGTRALFDARARRLIDIPVYARARLAPGDFFHGPAVIAEDETTTLVPAGFDARINDIGTIVLRRRAGEGR